MEGGKITQSVKQTLQAHLRKKFTWIREGTSDSQSRLEKVYTRLYITPQDEVSGSKPHEILDHFKFPDERSQFLQPGYQAIECLNIFSPERQSSNLQQPPARDKRIRSVMTKGIAGIGKTFAVQNFFLNWAEGRSNQHIDFIFVLPFRELNMLREGEYSLLQLLLLFYPELKPFERTQQLANTQLLFIFDGLDESRFLLDFNGCARVSDVDQTSTVDVLLTNLFQGNLLPNAQLWVTSRPAAVHQIPPAYIDRMTDVQGFTDQDKEVYFRKRFSTENQAEEVLSCLQGMISFHFMGHIPIFCWIIAEVFKEGWSDQRSRKITTMTELYNYYLIIQKQRTTQKYGEKKKKRKKNKTMSKSQNATLLLNLSKSAFEQLQKGKILFYEEDLRECGIDVDEASEFCGFCSEILKQECGLYQKKMFSFVHLSFQEFLAALYLFHCCMTKNFCTLESFLGVDPTGLSLLELQKKVVDKALQNEDGQLDLLLCFFLGLSLESNQTMLRDLLPEMKSSLDTVEEMKLYLKNFHAGNIPQQRCMNLFLCKFELKEERFQDDVRMYLDTGARLSPIDCGVLSTLLQLSGEVIEELDLTKCFTPFVGTKKLVQLVKNCKKAALKSEHQRHDYLNILLSTLQSAASPLRELCLVCLSNANVGLDHSLFDVLGSPDCKLEILRLTGFSLDFVHCQILASILQSKPSSLKVLDLTDCIYSYPQDHSGCYTRELKMNVEYDDVDDELSLLTVIPAALIGPICTLEEFRMPGCLLKAKSGQVFASVLSSGSQLRELDLSRNELRDLGVQLLSVGLGSSKCRLETLRLSCCGITEEGCVALDSALKLNPSHLRELDLSYNHPGESGVKLLSERLHDPNCRLDKLNVDHNEEHWVNPQLLYKYACDLTFDLNTINEHLILSESNRTLRYTKEKQPYPDHPERFDHHRQVLCREGLTGRCYWEVKWDGFSTVGVAYKSMKRKEPWDSELHHNDKAWCHTISVWNGNSFRHGLRETFKPVPIIDVQAFLARPRRLGLFLDWPAGILSFYWLSGDKKTLIHTFHTTFTEPLHPAFTVYDRCPLTLSNLVKAKTDSVPSTFTPEVVEEKRSCPAYRFKFPGSGLFRCSLTDLVFSVTHEGEVAYKTLIWNDKLLLPAGKVQGGPLFSITCPQDSIRQLHLPHCEAEPALVSQTLSVAHITDEGMSIIKPLEVTETHVVVDVPHLSQFGIVWDIVKRFKRMKPEKPLRGQVLLFLRQVNRKTDILDVVLVPNNVPLHQVTVQYTDSQFIKAPSFCLFHKGREYSLHCEPEDFKIQPDRSDFWENYGPNYHPTFDVLLSPNTEEVTVMLRDRDGTQVWEHYIRLSAVSSEPSPSGSQPQTAKDPRADEKLQNARVKFVARVSDPVLNKLLDELHHCGVLSDAEDEAVRVKPRGDKARDLLDMVRKKGATASSKMISIFRTNDPYMCKELGLN